MKDLGIIVVNFNARDLLSACLASVLQERDVTYEVWVVDNVSGDGSAQMVRERFPQARLIESPRNGGYAYGNNLALRAMGFADVEAVSEAYSKADALTPTHSTSSGQASILPHQGGGSSAPTRVAVGEAKEVRGDGLTPSPLMGEGWDRGESSWHEADTPSYRYILLLNPDTQVSPGDLRRTIDYMDGHADVGVLGVKLVRADGSLDLACRRSFPTPEVSFYKVAGLSRLFPRSRRFGRYNLTYLDPDETAEIDTVAGAFMLVQSEAIRQAGLLDERFFMYGEDIDWNLRMKQHGWKVVYYPEVVILHHKGGSSTSRPLYVIKEFCRSMLLFYDKHYAASRPVFLRWLVMAGIGYFGALRYGQYFLHRLRGG